MLEMAACRAKVLHLRCVEYARRFGLPIHVRSSFSQREGTWCCRDMKGTRWKIRSSPVSRTIAARPRYRGRVPDRPGQAAAIFSAVAGAGINIDMIVQNVSRAATGRTDISFTAPRADGAARRALQAIQERTASSRCATTTKSQGLADRRGHAIPPGCPRSSSLAWPMRGEHRDDLHLGDPHLGVVREDSVNTAVLAVHKAFDLDSEDEQAVVYGVRTMSTKPTWP